MTNDQPPMMSDTEDRQPNGAEAGDEPPDGGSGRAPGAMASAKAASELHVALAVPLRAVERNRRVASSVLAGGFAYRLFLWLLPFGLLVGGGARLHECEQHRGCC